MSQLDNLADASEIAHYEEALARYLDLELDAERFTALRLQQGVYGQRQEGVNMVRIKLPGGRLDPARLAAIAEVAEKHVPQQVAHITTRQDIQLHHVPLAETGAVLRRLAEDGVTTREACGNTIRNITACPLAGVCPREHTDVTAHLDGAVAHFLRNPLNQQMPRKFKVSFSGCEADCAQGLIHDLGIVATRRGERSGFTVLAGGGLGHKPHEAITVAEFIEEQDLLPAMEAVITLHNKYSDRSKRAKSRIKFLVDRFGEAGFIECFNEEFARTRAALAGKPVPKGEWRQAARGPVPGPGAPRVFFAQRQAGLHVVPISAPLGQLKSDQLAGLAALLGELGLEDVRAAQDQNLIVLNVPAAQIAGLVARLADLGLRTPQAGDNVVACPGASTCRLGITTSMHVAPKLSGGKHDLRLRVSGCQNGCAQPESGDIGIYGEGKRQHGKLIPHYQMYFGGDGTSACGAIALKGPSIPAARIEQAITRVQKTYDEEHVEGERFFGWAQRQGAERFQSLLADLTQVSRFELAKLARDHGDAADFRVVSLGGGECASATDVAIGRAFFDAAHERSYREAFVFQRKLEDAAACAEAQLRLVGEGLAVFLGGGKAKELADITAVLRRPTFSEALGGQLAQLAERLAVGTTAEEVDAKRLFADIDQWIVDAAALCLARDPQLDLRGALPAVPAAQPAQRSEAALA
ncbi:MAG: nitrite/sulfite reductase [Rhodocyclaceae bacterium]|jgi:sulfite reductase (ferredoxin)|nr:nitrite/sulfite reductase [Rhodocyclaceae bacterium]